MGTPNRDRRLAGESVSTWRLLDTEDSQLWNDYQAGAFLIVCPNTLNISERDTFGLYVKLPAGSVRHNFV